MAGDNVGNLLQRVQDAGTGFAMDQADVGNAAVSAEQTLDIGCRGRYIFRCFK